MSETSVSSANPQRLGLGRRLQKLRAMSWGELATRIRYRAYCAWEMREHARGRFADPQRLRRGLVPPLDRDARWSQRLLESRRAAKLPWLPGVTRDERGPLLEAFGTRFAAERERTIQEADRVLRGQVTFFGKSFSCGPDVDWHADPVTRRRWPVVYHGRVPSGGGDVGFGDVKHVWELSRHQFFIDLAKAYALTGDPRYARHTRDLHASWCQQNPYGTGVNWSCALEPAFRVLSWLWAYPLVIDALGEDDHRRWLESFYDHGHFLYRHLEYYASPYNHLIGEVTALFLLGWLFPEFSEARAWRQRGRRILETSVVDQFHTDGGTVEQSTFYHHATLGFYLLAALTARRAGAPLSAATEAAIVRGLEFSMNLQQPDGCVPAVGGADDGKPIRLEHVPFWDFRPYLATGAVLFDRGDFKQAAGRFWEDALWLLGTDGLAAYDRLERAPRTGSVALPASGYVVLRGGDTRSADYLCFDCGPQAAGLRRDDTPSAAHGHADCLSVVVWLAGQPVLVDSGFYCYNGDPAWEVHFRKTRAHNTLELDGMDQAQHVSKMAWCRTYSATLHGWSSTPHGAWARGSHDGYRRLSDPVRHQRAVCLRRMGYAVILDELQGRGQHDVALHFHFAPGAAQLDAAGRRLEFQGRARLGWTSSAAFAATLVNGSGPAPTDGWIAESLEVASAAPYLRLTASTVQLPLVVITIVEDTHAHLRVRELEADPSERIIEVASTDATEWIHLGSHTEEPATAAFVWRLDGGRLEGCSPWGVPLPDRPPPAIVRALGGGAAR